MLALNRLRWKELSHAYGEASNTSLLIEQLKTAPPPKDYKSEPWYSIWSSLCHQNDVYSASYAASPHLVAIVATKPAKERLEFLHFIVWVEVCRHRNIAPPIPQDLQPPYVTSLDQAKRLVLECVESQWDNEQAYRILLGALAVLRGQPLLGAAIIELERESDCPKCNSVFLTKGYDLFEPTY